MKDGLMRLGRMKWLGLILGFLLFNSGCTLNAFEQIEAEQAETPPTPSPEFSPDQVVRMQLEALQQNDETNQGIATAFGFASPGNKQSTGPLPRFIKMLKSPPYDAMLNHKSVEYGPIKIAGNTATQRVTLTGADGQAIIYIFMLSKQMAGEYKDCWMTDGVMAEPAKSLPQDQA